MTLANCCANQQLAWTQSRVGERWSDLYVCASCKHVHAMESWPAPLDWPGAEKCVNCGGPYGVPSAKRGKSRPQCERCGLTPEQDKQLHDGLASAHPEKSYIKGAEVAVALGRNILALKLATAATRWGAADEAVAARTLRIQILDAIGQVDRALDEVYDWAHNGAAPPSVWGLIATIEGGSGNVDGAVKALKYGVQVDPENPDMWADYAEILLLCGDGGRALDAARHVLEIDAYRERGLAVIVEVSTALLQEGRAHDAKVAANAAGPYQDTNLALAWLQARIAAQENDEEQAVAWLQKTLAIDPAHAEALAARDALKPAQRRGWLW